MGYEIPRKGMSLSLEVSGHLPHGLFSLKDFYYSLEWRQTHSTDSPKDYKVSSARFGNLSIQGSASTTKPRISASVSSWQNKASCLQDNVFKRLIKDFLDITSPCKAIFWWLNYKWIRNIWNEFPLGLAKHTLDFIPTRIFERWFRTFVESNMGSLFPVPFLCSGPLGWE